MKKSRLRTRRGFTLIELLVVVSIMGMLSSVVLAAVNNARDRGTVSAGLTFDDHTYHAFGADMAAHWKFDEGSGSTVKDDSNTGNDLTLTNPSWAGPSSGIRGNALAFSNSDGNGGRSGTKTAFKNFSRAHGSISFWIKELSTSYGTGGSGQWIFQYGGVLTIATASSFCNPAVMRVTIGTTNYCFNAVTINSIQNKWTHIAVSWTSTNLQVYLNGQKIGEYSIVFPSTGSEDVTIGSGYGTEPNGILDEMRIYSQSLQTAQVQKLYAEGLPRHTLAKR